MLQRQGGLMNEDHETLLFCRLAVVSAERGQPAGRDRFLILAGISATRAGWPAVAARCHQLVTARAPRHLLNRYPSFADALRDPEFEPFSRQVRRSCSPERAEHLLAELGRFPSPSASGEVTAEHVLELLSALE